MTDKEIIIGSVDVSGCKHYNPEQYFECNIGCCHCEENPNCHYKQLKRKEQALNEIEKYLDAQQKYFDGEDYHNLLDIINKVKEEINEES